MKDLYIIPEIWLCNQSGFVWTIVPLLFNQANKILWWSCLIHQPDLEASTFAGLINVFVSGNVVIRFKKIRHHLPQLLKNENCTFNKF